MNCKNCGRTTGACVDAHHVAAVSFWCALEDAFYCAACWPAHLDACPGLKIAPAVSEGPSMGIPEEGKDPILDPAS